MEHAYIIDGRRSYIGIENGIYKHIPAEVLGAEVLDALVPESLREDIEEVIVGNGVGASGNIGRLMTLTAHFPEKIPAYTVDMQCGSGLEALTIAAAKIKSSQADLIAAGGVDSSSTAPRRAYNPNHPDYEAYGGEQSFYSVAKFAPGFHDPYAMLRGAERTAQDAFMTRQELNKWVIRSHTFARQTRDEKKLEPYLVSVNGAMADSGIRDRMKETFLNKLPLLLPDGKVLTVGNTCLTNDGAAFLLVASESYVRQHALTPLAEIVDSVTVGGNPAKSPETVILAIQKLLAKNDLQADDISVFECNEAFAVIDELFARTYPDAVGRYNCYGGALAYGHPYGASGGIITLHACLRLQEHPGYAVCSIAAAGGVGHALLLHSLYSLKDSGRMDDSGNFYFLGRTDDIVGVRGRKISMLKIENAIEEIDGIQEAAVLVLQKEDQEDASAEIVSAYVTVEKDALPKDIRQKLKQKLSDFEIPKRFTILKELPKNTSGKIDKNRLRQMTGGA